MPHLRSRYLQAEIQKALKWSPVLSVLGMRQVGKTTLLKECGRSYLSLDDEVLRIRWEAGDWSELESGERPLVIDEAQKSPGVFDRVKLLVDRQRRPGQFVLTGSVRFLSKRDIRESLTGRTALLELLPLTLREAHSRPLGDFVSCVHRGRTAFKHCPSEHDVQNYLEAGGMPGICFKRDLSVQRQMRESHLETVLLRDLQLLVRTRVPYVKLRALLQALAQGQGAMISARELARRVQVSTPTVQQLLAAFVDLFLVRPHGKTYYFTDCGMASFLGASRVESRLFQMERWVFSELLAQLTYRHRAAHEFWSFSTRGGARVPFVIQIEGLPTLAIVVDETEGASEKSLKSLTVFRKNHRGQCKTVVLHCGDRGYEASTGALCLPYRWIA